jgi:hypothetical protein
MLVQQYRGAMLRRAHRKGRLSIGLHEESQTITDLSFCAKSREETC